MVVSDRVRADAGQGGGWLVADRISYRKLPGRRRGFLRGSSVWLGPDHLLLVKSMRFREEYKRYQLRDIQAIAIAHRPRFHISTRAFGIGVLWLIAYFYFNLFRIPRGTTLLWALAMALFGVWLYVSTARSCTCRIYTAVSGDELPSVYRTWVASKFLRAVEPQITAVQGALEGAWTEAVGSQNVGPRETLPPQSAEAEIDRGPASTSAARTHAASYSFLLATLFFDSLWHALALYHPFPWASVVSNLLALLVIGGAILVLVRNHRRRVPPAQQRLAIAALIAMGLVYYVRLTVVGALAGAKAAIEKKSISLDYSGGPITSEIEMGITLLLGLVGLGILIAGRTSNHEPRSMAS
jgi:hypothetical protein